MESQKDRFIREFMLIKDDRKIRGFDQQSIERKQRIMPQGQKDLGIYPGEDNEGPEQPTMRFGYVDPLTNASTDDLAMDGQLYIFNANENLDSMRFNSNFSFEITSPNLVITNCDIFNIFAERVSASTEYYTARFEYCTFYFGGTTYIECSISRDKFMPDNWEVEWAPEA